MLSAITHLWDCSWMSFEWHKTAHLSYSNFTGFQFPSRSNTKLCGYVTTQSPTLPSFIFLKYCSFTALPALSPVHHTQTCLHSNAITTILKAFTLSSSLVLTSATTFPMTLCNHSIIILVSLLSQTNLRHFLWTLQFNNPVLHPFSL